MNTAALKPFAQQARHLLRVAVQRRLIYWGFDAKGNTLAEVEAVGGGYAFRGKVSDNRTVPSKWNKLKNAIVKTSFDEVVEKASYTWFNRLLAIKILSKNGYETAQLDYLTDETKTPAMLERARRGQYSFLNNIEQQRLQLILTDYEKEQEAFAILLIGYCHQHPLLQGIFGSIDDYTELLLPDDILRENGFLYFLNNSDAITEEDYKQVELIGWLYQFYISEKKDEVFAGFKQNKKAEAKDIPAATQIFTPNWIVKYLVQNTLGRTWLDAYPNSKLKNQWKYLVEPSTNNDISNNLGAESLPLKGGLEGLNFLDPAVGSGHILVEAFDTYYPMYLAEFYNPQEAVQSILQNNLFGLDLDTRAAQLAQFALIIKAAQYSRTVLSGNILPHVYAMPQPRFFTIEEVKTFLGEAYVSFSDEIYKALQTMEQAHNLGSIMVLTLTEAARKAIQEREEYWQSHLANTLEEEIVKEVFTSYTPIIQILTNKFVCIAANPPYMGQKNMNGLLKNYVNRFYSIGKSDLMTVFMEAIPKLTLENGRFGLINLPSWLFLSTFQELREEYISKYSFDSLIHMGRGIFGIDFGSVAFILNKNSNKEAVGSYFRLHERNFQHIYYSDIEKLFLYSKNKPSFKYDFSLYRDEEGITEILEVGSEEGLQLFYPNVPQKNFNKIQDSPIAYWITHKVFKNFIDNKSLDKNYFLKAGLQTGNNDTFLKLWYEVDFNKINFHPSKDNFNEKIFAKYDKGGAFRKWYGNNSYVINWKDNGDFLARTGNPVFRNSDYYFQRGISYSLTTSTGFGARMRDSGFIFDNQGSSLFSKKDDLAYPLALLNSKITSSLVNVLNPTMVTQVGDLSRIPFSDLITEKKEIADLVNSNIIISKKDWDSRETSWDFQANVLLGIKEQSLETSYKKWYYMISFDFFRLRRNEMKLNEILIEIYDLVGEQTPDVLLKHITILQEELDYAALEKLQNVHGDQLVPIYAEIIMQQLISYALGCYMGRYRLDKPGLNIAQPNPSEKELLPYSVSKTENRHFLFQIDDDAIIPFMGTNGSFTDDILYRVKEFLSIVWGDDTLTANLNFLQQQLGKDLENYLVKDFWKNHVQTYSKKPIYWLFASKKNAFQVLVYMHRMNAYTLAIIRSKYLIPHISWIKNQVIDLEKNAASLSKSELKKLDTLRKQVIECEEYDLLLKDFADKQISFDLDDGVTRNYALFDGIVALIK